MGFLPSWDPLSCGKVFYFLFFGLFWALQGQRRPTVKDTLPQRGVHVHAFKSLCDLQCVGVT